MPFLLLSIIVDLFRDLCNQFDGLGRRGSKKLRNIVLFYYQRDQPSSTDALICFRTYHTEGDSRTHS